VGRALATLDPESADLAESALRYLLGEEEARVPVEHLSRLELQSYLWVTLPAQHGHLGRATHEVAWALGDALERLGAESLAVLCRDRRTHEILAAWQRDPAEGERLSNEAFAASGLLTDVRRERALAWAAGFPGGPHWVSDVLPVLEAEAEVPENVELSLAPARALMEAVGDGLTLTGAGYLPTSVAIALNDHFRWSDRVGITPKKEGDVPPLRFLREHLMAQQLLTVRRGLITVSTRGRDALSDPAVFWAAVTETAPRWDDFEQEVLAVAAVLLVGSPDVEHLSAEITARLADRWLANDLERDVNWVFLDWYRVGLSLGWWDAKRGRWLDRLSPRGVAAAARAFWAVAAKPIRATER